MQTPTSTRTHSPWRWYVCGLVFLATTINYLDRSVFSLLEPTLKTLPFMQYDPQHPQLYTDHFSTILAWFQFAYGAAFLCAGVFIDKVGTKIGYAVAILIWSLAAASHAFVASVAGFIIARMVLGIGEAGNFPAAIKAATEWFPAEERAFATGIFNSGANVAAFTAPYIVAHIAIAYGWKAAFVTTGLAGLLWLALWLPFRYDARQTSNAAANLTLASTESFHLSSSARTRGMIGFCTLKAMTDPVWWFFLFWLPKYFSERYGLDMKRNILPLFVVYLGSAVGSVSGGWISGFRMRRGASVNSGRKSALLICAVCALPVVFVPWMPSVWGAVGLLALATAAHQGFSANTFSTASDIFPSARVSTVVSIGGASGSFASILFTKFVGAVWLSHPRLIFLLSGTAYLCALLLFHLLVPHLGRRPASVVEITNP